MKKPDKPLGLYIHIPFCKSKCIYCDFYSLAGAEKEMNRYTAALSQHLAETAPLVDSYLVDSIYFGGGTPSLLGTRRLSRLLKTISKYYHVAGDAEITLEANPDSAGDWRKLRALRKAGINRVSLGVQSANDKDLQTLGRPHTFAQAVDAVGAVRTAGIKNLSLDLIYGLPDQTLPHWQRSLNHAAALEPEHISCYGLKVEEGTPLWDRRNDVNLPNGDAQADMYLWAVERLAQLGYKQYEISNFAKPGFASRHNLKYWTLGEYAGFGPGAHSDLGGTRYAFVRDLAAYCQGIKGGGDILAESERIPPRERDLEYLMLGLRTTQGIDRREFESRFGLPFAPMETVLRQFLDSGHAIQSGSRWRLTPEGFLVSNPIIGQVLDALAQEKQRRREAVAGGDYRFVR